MWIRIIIRLLITCYLIIVIISVWVWWNLIMLIIILISLIILCLFVIIHNILTSLIITLILHLSMTYLLFGFCFVCLINGALMILTPWILSDSMILFEIMIFIPLLIYSDSTLLLLWALRSGRRMISLTLLRSSSFWDCMLLIFRIYVIRFLRFLRFFYIIIKT